MNSPFVSELNAPQRLKPRYAFAAYGTTEVVPFPFVLDSNSCSRVEVSLLDDLECVALAGPSPSRGQQRAHGTHGASLTPDHLAHIVFRDFEFDHVVVKVLDENFIGRIDQS